ncbi:MAG: hypothetical protein JSU86_02065 [Phycisphaerales bacterium]|nr:MAG: hypothetical protein JSU86_02065 [Phycisphaerales bacterium]
MYRLLTSHFDGVTRDQFRRDLANKNWVVLLEDDAGVLRGFSTLDFYHVRNGLDPVSVVYSGDTIVERSAWSSPAFLQCWMAAVMQMGRETPGNSLYWLLITSGYRTYRLLPVFWREFYPRYDRVPSPKIERLACELASRRFGPLYDPDAGIVRFTRPQILRADLRGIPPRKRKDPHVQFFAARNPGYARGDQLTCLAEISRRNLTRAGRRLLAASRGRGAGS